jgi:hypothetical protein
MKCPHCRVEFHDKPVITSLGKDVDGYWIITRRDCPACKRMVLTLTGGDPLFEVGGGFGGFKDVRTQVLMRPKSSLRPPCPREVPESLAEDYTEACLVLPDSPKASAALSRRCLQYILREKAGVKPSNLSSEIQEVIDRGDLPSHLAEVIDAVRNIGNFAAHPIKSESTGEILPVEPGEAEWNLDVLEALFDFYFVQPAIIAKKKEALNAKLREAGKTEMK